jgi:hypothetical protein
MRIPVTGWVAPFGDPGITDRSHLPRAFRSVPRPSSPLSAKASTRCPSIARSKYRKHAKGRYHDTQTPPRTGANPKSQPARQSNRCYRPDQQPSRRGSCSAHGVLSMKTLLRTVPLCDASRRRQSRPPRSHSQIHFTRSINTRPDTRPQRGQPRPMRNTRENRSSPNAMGSEVRSQTLDPFRSLIAPTFDWSRRISGGERDRTDDLLLAKQALSQLSYTPVSGIRNLLSDPRCLIPGWWAREDLNLRPHAYQARALTS